MTAPKSSKSKAVRVWSDIGVSLPIGQDTYAHFRVNFGHERWAKDDSPAELKKATRLIDEFNEDELDRQIKKFARLVAEAVKDVEVENIPDRQKKARKKLNRR